MLKQKDLRIFLTQNNDPAKFSLSQTLTTLSYYLDARITLIDNSGSILYGNSDTSLKNQENNILGAEKISLSIKEKNDATLTIEKTKFTQLEKVLIEMVSGIISIHMR